MKYIISIVIFMVPVSILFGQNYEEEFPEIVIDSINCGNIYKDGENIGMGTSDTFGYKMAVIEGLISEGIKLDYVVNWPDYVFGDNYLLRPLEDLESYIEEFNHLPGMPTAEEVSKKGYSISDMDKLKLVKIEELTLYVIQLDKEISKMKKELVIKKNQEIKSKVTGGIAESYKEKTFHQRNNRQSKELIISKIKLENSNQDSFANVYCNGKNVGIGSRERENSKLTVAGGIMVDKLKVSSIQNWPDYVFNGEFKILDLDSLAKFIKKEKHLPGIPKARIIEENGYSPEEMDSILLEKIEVLSLYIINQKKKIKQLKTLKLQSDE